MKIRFKLFASLAEYLPSGARENAAIVEVDDGTTPNQLITQYNLPKQEVHLVLLNGFFQDAASRDVPMKDEDTLAIWPPVAGG